MKLGLVGYGRMGRLVETVALERGLEVAARFDSSRPLSAAAETRRQLDGASALIDFSVPAAVPATVRAAAELSQALVIGTTGWHDRLDEVRATAESAGIGLVHGANFSIGAHLLYRLADCAARFFAPFEQYRPYVEDAHHRHKLDSPSGTARRLVEILGRSYGDAEIPVSSLRAGYIKGRHTVGFDSPVDAVQIRHEAHSRRGFAEGALLAAGWIAGRRGVFDFDEVIADLGAGQGDG